MEERDTLKAEVGTDTSIAQLIQNGRDTVKQEDLEEQSKDKQAQFKNLFSYFKNKKGCSPIQEESSPGSQSNSVVNSVSVRSMRDDESGVNLRNPRVTAGFGNLTPDMIQFTSS